MLHHHVRFIPPLVGLLALAAMCPAAASAKTIGSSGASGDFAIAIASGSVNHPHRIWVKVTASPRQRVTGNWTMVCAKGMGAGSKSGRFSGRTTLTRTLRMPMRRPHDCTVSAGAQLDDSGHVRVRLFAR